MNMKLHFDRPRRNPIYDEYIVTASMLTQFGNSAAKASKSGMAGMHREGQ